MVAESLSLPYIGYGIDLAERIACIPTWDPNRVNSSLQIVSISPPVGVIAGMTPASGTSCVPTSGVLLEWSADPNAVSYEVQVGTACGAGSAVTTTATEYFAPSLSANETYYWRVRGQNVCGHFGTWSACQELSTAPFPLSSPSLVTPANGAIDQPIALTLQWNPVGGAASYEIQWGISCATGSWEPVGTNEYPVSGLNKGETYYWRVAAVDACGLSGTPSGCYSFTVIPFNTPTGTDVTVEPGAGITLGFDEVTGGGDTTVDESSVNPGPDVNSYMFQGTFYDINTTATYTGSVEVCLEYDDTGMTLEQELALRIFHLEGAAWVNITTSVDTDNNIICGMTESLSPFGVALFMPWRNDGTTPALASTDDAVGVSWGDFDDDGDPDLYVANHAQADKLFRNDGSGVFTDVTTTPLGHSGEGSVGCWADVDNDGDRDLYLTVRNGANVLYENTEYGFVDVTAAPLNDAGESQGAAWFDYDVDGDLDVYVSNYSQANRLYRNDGGGSFTDVTAAPLDDAGQSTGAAIADYDGDGDSDIYLTNTGVQPNRLFRNDGGGNWADVTPAPLALTTESRGAAWGDFDNDGDLDLYVANGAGANQLFRNDGSGVFADVSFGVLADAGSTRGVGWQDFDNDGDLDLYVANLNSANTLIRNEGFGIFTDGTVTPGGRRGLRDRSRLGRLRRRRRF